jgi:SprT protein
LWQQHGFLFKIAKNRLTRLGDYQYSLLKGHRITVNGTLNPYAFTFTYLHEVAHLLTQKQVIGLPKGKRKPKVLPHGQEWKQNFRELMQPLLAGEAFPLPLRMALQQHMVNPAATSGSDAALLAIFRTYDEVPATHKILLAEVLQGEQFSLNGRVFVKETTRRTRALCRDLKTQRKYTVSEAAMVEKA